MPRIKKNKTSILIEPSEKKRATFYLKVDTLNKVQGLANLMDVNQNAIIDKSVQVYTELVSSERKELEWETYANS